MITLQLLQIQCINKFSNIHKNLICTFKINPLQWNGLRISYGNYKLFIDFKLLSETKELSVVKLHSYRLGRLELKKSLKDKGHKT